MASILRKNSSINQADYNNFILKFTNHYKKYQSAVREIVKSISKTVMIENVWTDQYAQDYALWFNDESGITDGCDRLNGAMSKMEALFKTTCFMPIKDVVKLIGEEELSSLPMIKKAYHSKDIYNVLGVKKYRKANFPKLNLKRKKGWKTVTRADRINEMLTNIEKNVKILKNESLNIQKLVKQYVLTSGTACIMITGFNNAALTKKISEITNTIDKFSTMSTKRANKAIDALNTTQSNLVKNIGDVVEDNDNSVVEDNYNGVVEDK